LVECRESAGTRTARHVHRVGEVQALVESVERDQDGISVCGAVGWALVS